jgi:histidyl-tRNA synthetase
MRFDLPRGMRDLDVEEYENIVFVKNAFFETAKTFNFKIMEPSPLELLSTLESKSGPSIINEIYSFTDKGGRKVALRFDLTIGLTRFFASRRDLKIPAKIASFGGVWRYDEPQSGRYRFFHQWDIEIYGPNSLELDIEIIEFTSVFLNRIGLENAVIDISSRELLEEHFRKNLGVSSNEKLFEMFRAIDKISKKGKDSVIQEYKGKIDTEILEKAIEFAQWKGSYDEIDKLIRSLNLETWKDFKKVIQSLYDREINNVRINFGIVRGLDYYSGIVFEAIDPDNNIGSLVGGGRYNKLIETFGRADMGSTGAAGGIERIILALKNRNIIKEKGSRDLIFIAYDPSDSEMKNNVQRLASALRKKNLSVDYDLLGRSLSKQLSDAESKKAKDTIIFKREDLKSNRLFVVLKQVTEEGRKEEKRVMITENFDKIINELL